MLSFFIERETLVLSGYSKDIQVKIEDDLNAITDKVGLYLSAAFGDSPKDFNALFSDQEYVYLFENSKLKHWSRADYIPRYFQIQGDYRLRYFESESGIFVVKRTKVLRENSLTEVFILIELYRKYPFFNKYLKSAQHDRYFLPQYNTEVRRADATTESPIFIEGLPIFEIDVSLKKDSLTLDNYVRLAVGVTIIFVFLLFLYRIFKRRFDLTRRLVYFYYLLFTLVAFRVIIYYLPFPKELDKLDVFSPALVNLSYFNLSLGDTFLNSLFILVSFWFLLRCFFKSNFYVLISTWLFRTRYGVVLQYLASASFIVIGLLATIYQYQTTYTVLFNSPIEFDVSRSLLFGVNEVLLLLVICCNGISFFILLQLLCRLQLRMLQRKQLSFVLLTIIIAAVGVVAYFFKSELLPLYVVFFLYAFVTVFFEFPRDLGQFKYNTFLYFLLCSSVISFVHSYGVFKKQWETDLLDKKRFANDLLIESDLLAEYLISDISDRLNNDLFVISRMLSSSMNKDDVIKKIKRVYFNNYFDKYDIKINLFDAKGHPWISEPSGKNTYSDFLMRYAHDRNKTEYNNLYLVGTDEAITTNRYFQFVDLKRYEKEIGHILIELRLKSIIPHNVYPELLVDYQFSDFFTKKQFDYAIYRNDSLAMRYGGYNNQLNFNPDWLFEKELYTKGLEKRGYHHFAVKSKVHDKVITITSRLYEKMAIFSNFSFLLLLFLIVIVVLVVFNYKELKIIRKINLSSKIQFFISIAFSIPLISLSIVISNSLDASFKANANKKYVNQASVIANYMIDDFASYINGALTREIVSNKVAEIAKFTQVDLNLYDNEGELLSSSQPSIYDNNLHSDFANPKALNALRFGNSDYVIYPETLGKLTYQTLYHGLKSYENGALIGMIGLPFFDAESSVQQQQVVIFNQVIRVFSIIFLLSLFGSYYVGKILTKPLSLIANRLRSTNFQNKNEPIKYDSSDEIGLMVKEYNVMLENLEKSKGVLAMSEKESAWKEIAKQVAHEIKNPLTPMKLKLQHLSRLSSKEDFDAQQLKEPVESLLAQVNTLNDIASSFSSFARMPIPENEKFDVVNVLTDVTELFNQDKGFITLTSTAEHLLMMGDTKLMRRVFNNLLLNAYQSIPDGVTPAIRVVLSELRGVVKISIADNGRGIPTEVADKVFTPNFTTKSSGSGIGLAVTKRGVELMQGKIWFETKVNEGTTFFLEFPLTS